MQRTLRALGQLSLTIDLSAYPASDEEDEHEAHSDDRKVAKASDGSKGSFGGLLSLHEDRGIRARLQKHGS